MVFHHFLSGKLTLFIFTYSADPCEAKKNPSCWIPGFF